ncbi:hypothetical protein SU32_13475 [Ahrensia marina]|uniref:Uncharacterized protein n=1 Tax=Ahrensia marina TaxID=1514904 RepID=A0A0M9GLF0_9HYPH|nr:hypothetical protein SU32_13475 [Ahrensia marina]
MLSKAFRKTKQAGAAYAAVRGLFSGQVEGSFVDEAVASTQNVIMVRLSDFHLVSLRRNQEEAGVAAGIPAGCMKDV